MTHVVGLYTLVSGGFMGTTLCQHLRLSMCYINTSVSTAVETIPNLNKLQRKLKTVKQYEICALLGFYTSKKPIHTV